MRFSPGSQARSGPPVLVLSSWVSIAVVALSLDSGAPELVLVDIAPDEPVVALAPVEPAAGAEPSSPHAAAMQQRTFVIQRRDVTGPA
jgi:hypothetical protein